MVSRNIQVYIILISMLLLEGFIFYLLMTGTYTSPLCLD